MITQPTPRSRRRGRAAVALEGLTTALMSDQTARRLEQLFQGLPVACFCYDSAGRITEWNRTCTALFGLSGEQALLRPAWEMIGRPEDQDIIQALLTSVAGGQAYEGFQWEDIAPGGTRRHLLSSAFPLYGDGQGIIGGISTVVDISERVQMEQTLWENEERWKLALRGNNDGIWDWDAKRARLFVSERWKQMLGYDDEDLPETQDVADIHATWFARVHPDDRAAAHDAFEQHLEQDSPFYTSEHRVRCKDGSYKWVLDRGQGLRSRTGEVMRVAGSFTDITQRKGYEQQLQDACRKLEAANARLEALATQDGLTGLKNHRAFQERLSSEVECARRYGLPLSLVLLDVDHFKQYNDTFGHPAGDEVLIQVARLLQQSVREADMVARYGGEEFVLVLPHTDLHNALLVAERCRAALEAAAWPQRPVTASFGLAMYGPAADTGRELVSAADRALYAAKSGGRNRLHLADA